MNNGFFLHRNVILGCAVLCLAACGSVASPESDDENVSFYQTAAVQTFVLDLTRKAPTSTSTPSPTWTPFDTPTVTITPTPSDTPTRMPISELMKTYLVYYVTRPIDTETDCKYYVTPWVVYPYVPRTGDYETDITRALTILFSIKDLGYENYNNLLAASSLNVERLEKSGTTLNVYLEGNLNIYGPEQYCKDRQVNDQILYTVEQFKDLLMENGINPSNIVGIYHNELLEDLLLHDRYVNTNP